MIELHKSGMKSYIKNYYMHKKKELTSVSALGISQR